MKTNKLSLLLMAGNAVVGDDYIDFTGINGVQKTAQQTFSPADVRTNLNIIEGDFRCSYIITGSDSFFSINLWTANDNLLIRINELPHFCSIKKYQNGSTPLISYTGEPSAVVLNEKVSLTVRINSNFVSVLIKDIIVLTQFFPHSGVNVGFNIFGGSPVKIEDIVVVDKKPKVFVVMQFQENYNELYEEVIKPTCYDFGFDVARADESVNNSSVIRDIITELTESTLVIADITPDNPNVYYEVGYAHAIKKDVILLCNESREKLPFDLADFRTVFYKDSIAGHTQIKDKLRKHLANVLKHNPTR